MVSIPSFPEPLLDLITSDRSSRSDIVRTDLLSLNFDPGITPVRSAIRFALSAAVFVFRFGAVDSAAGLLAPPRRFISLLPLAGLLASRF
jgi:hypothetical protein